MLCAVARARYRPPLAAGRALGLGGEVRGSWRAGSRSASSCCRRTSCLFLLHVYFFCMLVYFSCMLIFPNMFALSVLVLYTRKGTGGCRGWCHHRECSEAAANGRCGPRKHASEAHNRRTPSRDAPLMFSWRWVYILGCAATAPPVHGLTLAGIATSVRAAVEPAVLSEHASGVTPLWVQTSSDVRTGVCTFYDAEKGFGFIRQEGALRRGEELFVHHSDLGCSKMCCSRGEHKHVSQSALAAGQLLSFTVARHEGDGRTKATEVCKIERSDGAAAFDDDDEVAAMFDEFFLADVPVHERDYDLFDI